MCVSITLGDVFGAIVVDGFALGCMVDIGDVKVVSVGLADGSIEGTAVGSFDTRMLLGGCVDGGGLGAPLDAGPSETIVDTLVGGMDDCATLGVSVAVVG